MHKTVEQCVGAIFEYSYNLNQDWYIRCELLKWSIWTAPLPPKNPCPHTTLKEQLLEDQKVEYQIGSSAWAND